MKFSELNPAEDLRDKLKSDPEANFQVWTSQEMPSAGWPDYFVEIGLNGTINRRTSDAMLFEANLLVRINVKLMANGSANLKRQELVLIDLENALSRREGYVARQSTVYEGKSLVANYSTKIINLLVRLH